MAMILRWVLPRHIASGASAIVCILLGACGTDPTGVETCRSVEEARCRAAPNCNINLDRPVHNGDSPGDKVDACILWYHDACLHGLMAGEPDTATVQGCIAAINGGDCNVVAHPESNAACSWLIPPELRPPDAGPDAPP